MISRVAVSENRFFPKVLTCTDVCSYIFTTAFIGKSQRIKTGK